MRVKAEILRRFAPGHERRVSRLQWGRWWNEELHEILRLLLFDFEEWRPKTPAKELAMLFDPNIRHRRPTREAFAAMGQ